MAHVQIRRQGADDGGGIDAGVPVEALVLDAQQVADIVGIGARQVSTDTPAAIIDRQGAQPGTVVIEHHRRGAHRLGHVGREGEVEGAERNLDRQHADQQFEQRTDEAVSGEGGEVHDSPPHFGKMGRWI